VSLTLQDPDDTTGHLLATVLELCESADSGGGIFAFASGGGAKLLLEDEVFEAFANEAPFELVVGMDAITDRPAIAVVSEAVERLPGLQAAAFLHDRRPLLFHPKLCWFRRRSRTSIVVGSGNLTLSGLRTNWEGYFTSVLAGVEARKFHDSIAAWRVGWAPYLVPLDDPRVIDAARRNEREKSLLRSRRRRLPIEALEELTGESAQTLVDDTGVLVAEIPKAGGRWNQANFDLRNYEDFFGARVGRPHRILLRHVDALGRLEELESRPSVAVRSQNFRFELAAARGLAYPGRGRPVGVFVRLAAGVFIYRLVMPGDRAYPAIVAFLDDNWEGSANRVRRIPSSVGEVRRFWPDAPLWRFTAEDALDS
jgi:hypothetical protein